MASCQKTDFIHDHFASILKISKHGFDWKQETFKTGWFTYVSEPSNFVYFS